MFAGGAYFAIWYSRLYRMWMLVWEAPQAKKCYQWILSWTPPVVEPPPPLFSDPAIIMIIAWIRSPFCVRYFSGKLRYGYREIFSNLRQAEIFLRQAEILVPWDIFKHEASWDISETRWDIGTVRYFQIWDKLRYFLGKLRYLYREIFRWDI